MSAGKRRFRIHIEHQCQVRLETTGGESVQSRHLLPAKPAHQTLIDQRRIGETVAQNDRALVDCRPDDPFDVVATRCFESAAPQPSSSGTMFFNEDHYLQSLEQDVSILAYKKITRRNILHIQILNIPQLEYQEILTLAYLKYAVLALVNQNHLNE